MSSTSIGAILRDAGFPDPAPTQNSGAPTTPTRTHTQNSGAPTVTSVALRGIKRRLEETPEATGTIRSLFDSPKASERKECPEGPTKKRRVERPTRHPPEHIKSLLGHLNIVTQSGPQSTPKSLLN
jgi:hypothetical protein